MLAAGALASLLGLGAAALGPAACSTDAGYGAGGGGGTGEGGSCVAPDAPCAVLFTFPFNFEESVELRGDFAPGAWNQGVPMQLDGGQWRVSVAVPNGTTIHYKFFVDGQNWVTDPKNPDTAPDGVGGLNSIRVAACTAPICTDGQGGGDSGAGGGSGSGGGPVAGGYDWRSAVLYFVFVDRFANGDPSNDAPIAGVETQANYQGGDWAGLLQKIDDGYFDKLGVSALWLTVPMQNTNSMGQGSDGHQYSAYHGYWPTDLDQPEEHFGDMALLKKVVDHAHAHSLKVLFDYAMNHVHKDSPVYAQHPGWFWPLDYNGKNCVCGDGCDWNDPYEQKRCWFTNYLPDWNFTIDEARAYSVNNAIQWIKNTGIDGFRLDAVKHIETQWITDLRARVTKEIEPATKQHFYMVGETFESENRDFIKQYVAPTLLDGQFDFPLRGYIAEKILMRQASFYDLDGFLATNDGYYGGGAVMSTFIGNHDLARTIHLAEDQPKWGAWDNGGNANWSNPPSLPNYRAPFERLAVAYTFLLTTNGIPLIYYGDEIGMPGAGDPDNRRFMQWDNYTPDQLFLRGEIEKLTQIRKQHPALWKGQRSTASVTTDTYGYVMKAGSDVVYVALNRGDLPGGVAGMPANGHDLLSDVDVTGPSVTLPPRTAMVIVAK